MRKLTIRDLITTLIVAAVVVPFIGYSVRGSMPFVHDPRGMAGVGIAGCLLTFAAFGRERLGAGAFEWFMVTLGVLTLGFGIAAQARWSCSWWRRRWLLSAAAWSGAARM